MEESPSGVDTGDVYLGYPNNIVVPIITQTAPSEKSLELEIIDDAEIIEETVRSLIIIFTICKHSVARRVRVLLTPETVVMMHA